MAGRGSHALPMFVEGSEMGRDVQGKFRVATLSGMFDSQFRYDIPVSKWYTWQGGGGTVTYDSTNRAALLAANTTSGARALIQSRRYFRVLPAKAYHCAIAVLLGVGKTNVVQRAGVFDNTDGLFFAYNGTTVQVVTRKDSVDTAVAQTEWNMDKLDGMGRSSVTLDVTKITAFVIEHGGGSIARIRFGFMVGGRTEYVHELNAANEQTGKYCQTLQKPIRCEIQNTGTSASTTTLTVSGVTMWAEQEQSPETVTRGVHRGNRAVVVTTKRPVIAVRKRLSYKGKTPRDALKPFRVALLSANAPIFYELVVITPGNGTLVGANWTGAYSDSMCMYDLSATSVKRGDIKGVGFVESNGKNQPPGAAGYNAIIEYLTLNPSGTTGDILAINCSGIGGAATVYAGIEWFERA